MGVAHQYCGPLGKPTNCQVAVTVTSTSEAVSVPTAYQLYLPESWARDRTRRRVARVPLASVIVEESWADGRQPDSGCAWGARDAGL